MDFQEHIYSILVVSASESFNAALASLLPVSRFDPVRYAASISAAKRAMNTREYDFVIINSPLPDDSGTGFAIDISSTGESISLLIVRDDILEGIRDKVIGQGVFTLSKPLSTQMFTTALNWMASARERLRNSLIILNGKRTDSRR